MANEFDEEINRPIGPEEKEDLRAFRFTLPTGLLSVILIQEAYPAFIEIDDLLGGIYTFRRFLIASEGGKNLYIPVDRWDKFSPIFISNPISLLVYTDGETPLLKASYPEEGKKSNIIPIPPPSPPGSPAL